MPTQQQVMTQTVQVFSSALVANGVPHAIAQQYAEAVVALAQETQDKTGVRWIGDPDPKRLQELSDQLDSSIDAEVTKSIEATLAKMAESFKGWQRSANELHKSVGWDVGMPVKVASLKAGRGNADALRDWYEEGAGGGIDWGQHGDFDQCVAIAGNYLDDPEGFCQERHMAATGDPAGPGAHKAAKAAKRARKRVASK